MNDWKLPWNASCLCGAVRMRISAPPVVSGACHCRGCQKLTGGAYSLTLMVLGSGFAVEGETELGALRRPESQHHYCVQCKTWLYTTSPHLQGMVNVRSTMLDDASWVVPYFETYVSERLPGVVSGAKRSFGRYPPPEDYEGLMAGFAREGARPA